MMENAVENIGGLLATTMVAKAKEAGVRLTVAEKAVRAGVGLLPTTVDGKGVDGIRLGTVIGIRPPKLLATIRHRRPSPGQLQGPALRGPQSLRGPLLRLRLARLVRLVRLGNCPCT